MPIKYSKYKLTHNERKAWVPKELDEKFRKKIKNFQKWVREKMNEEVEK